MDDDMTATEAQISKVRRMSAERTDKNYSDAEIQAIIEAHPLVDPSGYAPDQSNWTATYDLNAAAADIWEEKAGGRTEEHDFSADGGSYSRSQMYEMAMKQSRHYRSRRSPSTIGLEGTPKDDDVLTDDDANAE